MIKLLLGIFALCSSLCLAGCIVESDDDPDRTSGNRLAASTGNSGAGDASPEGQTDGEGAAAGVPNSGGAPDEADDQGNIGTPNEAGDPSRDGAANGEADPSGTGSPRDPADGGSSTVMAAPAPAACAMSACGGDLVGTWNFEEMCPGSDAENPAADFCPTATFSNELNVSGTITINADGTYLRDMEMGGRVTFRLPAECLQPPITCAALGAGASSAMDEEGGQDIEELRCTQSNPQADCVCRAELVHRNETETGTYTIDGHEVIMGADGPEGDEDDSQSFDFCVQGDTATLMAQDQDDAGPLGGFILMR